jgi:cytochrome c oxidase subunit 2
VHALEREIALEWQGKAGMLTRFLLILLLVSCESYGNLTINMPSGVTDISQKVFQLHMVVLWICVAIGIIVFGVMIYAMIFHRRSLGHKAANFHENTKIEILWTVIPFIILIAMAVPATITILEMDDVSDSDLTVKITGYMWRWHYEYVGTNVAFMSDLSTPYEQIINRAEKDEQYLREVNNPLVLPINKKVRLLMTANDVIHSWWVPELAVKKDAIPGFINETWTKINTVGTYRGQCAELCGARHGFMPIVVKAVSEQEFAAWMQSQQQITVEPH